MYGGYKGIYDPHNRVLGPNIINTNDIWALKPNYLGPATLRVMQQLGNQMETNMENQVETGIAEWCCGFTLVQE